MATPDEPPVRPSRETTPPGVEGDDFRFGSTPAWGYFSSKASQRPPAKEPLPRSAWHGGTVYVPPDEPAGNPPAENPAAAAKAKAEGMKGMKRPVSQSWHGGTMFVASPDEAPKVPAADDRAVVDLARGQDEDDGWKIGTTAGGREYLWRYNPEAPEGMQTEVRMWMRSIDDMGNAFWWDEGDSGEVCLEDPIARVRRRGS